VYQANKIGSLQSEQGAISNLNKRKNSSKEKNEGKPMLQSKRKDPVTIAVTGFLHGAAGRI